MDDFSIEQVAASVAHEIKNPLQIIRANLQLIQLDDEHKHEKQYSIVYREIERISSLTSDFIKLTRNDELNFINFEFNKMLDDVIETFEVVFKEKNIAFTYINNCDCTVNGDSKKLYEVFINLFKNAVEALESRANKRIDLHIEQCDSILIITLTDNGIGIAQCVLDKIGLPFFSTKESGNGLGVSSAKRIIAKHGGNFTIESEENCWCRVSIALPSNHAF